jgi:hypothetical protein
MRTPSLERLPPRKETLRPLQAAAKLVGRLTPATFVLAAGGCTTLNQSYICTAAC